MDVGIWIVGSMKIINGGFQTVYLFLSAMDPLTFAKHKQGLGMLFSK